ncbi:MAG TPA: SDR family oxidoreductase [Lysobacter sp.]|nr:SDR family oxidoreductase [Lysobacter sp.]
MSHASRPASPRHCLVTGANRGMGLEFVRQLLARGDRVISTCRQPGKALALNTLAGDHPGRLHVLQLDVALPKSQATLLAELPLILTAMHDGAPDRIDLLINNAGVLHAGERFGSVTATCLDDSWHTNAAGPFLLTQALAPLLADGAHVTNLSSVLGSIAGKTAFRTPSYSMAKAALNMATVLLAHALAERGIVVMALHPGWVRTDMGGPKADADPADAVAAMLEVIDRAGPDRSGGFFDTAGQPIAW